MTTDELERLCIQAYLNRQATLTLTLLPGVKRAPGFPRGELLSVNPQGGRNYAFDPLKVMAWIRDTTTLEPGAL